jgi:hypothetical protein
VAIGFEPLLGLVVEPMAGPVVDDQEDLASTTMYELLEEDDERVAVEDGRELIVEPRARLDRDRPEDVPGLALAVCVYARLTSDRSPGPMETSVEPEARFVLECDNASARGRFFLILGNVSRSHTA